MASKSRRASEKARLGQTLRRDGLPAWVRQKAELYVALVGNTAGRDSPMLLRWSDHRWPSGKWPNSMNTPSINGRANECAAWGRRCELHAYVRLRFRSLRELLCHAAAHDLVGASSHALPEWQPHLSAARRLWWEMDHNLAPLTDIVLGHRQWEWIHSDQGDESRRHQWPKR